MATRKPRKTKRAKGSVSSFTHQDLFPLWIIVGILVIFVLFHGLNVWGNMVRGYTYEHRVWNVEDSIDRETAQALFLTNGQVYFGFMKEISEESILLENVYFLQQTTTTPKGTTEDDGEEVILEPETDIQLFPLGETEIHKPENMMVIERAQVLYWENMQADSQVVQAMNAAIQDTAQIKQED